MTLQEWNGQFYEKVTLKSLGLRIQLGHPIGEACSNPRTTETFVVLDANGIHEVGLDFCNCAQAQERIVQLLRFRLFPATVSEPNTAATFRMLKRFQLLSFMSKISAFEFYQTLVRLTDNTGTLTPPVSDYNRLS